MYCCQEHILVKLTLSPLYDIFDLDKHLEGWPCCVPVKGTIDVLRAIGDCTVVRLVVYQGIIKESSILR
jgi:hypothetical protein